MKGVVLAGGLGSRMLPLTKVTNKHLLPIYDKPMIYYPIMKLVEADVREIMIVTGGNYAGEFLRLLGNGSEFGLKRLHYAYQEGEGGIAHALMCAEDFVGNDKVCVILGDNIFEDSLKSEVRGFVAQPKGAKIFLTKVDDPERFGCAVFDYVGNESKLVAIEEKPEYPKSSYIVTGIYMYDCSVFEICKILRPSQRGELEVTDINNAYLRDGSLTHAILRGWWTDAGTFETMFRASALIAKTKELWQ